MMLPSEKLAIAAHLHVLLRRKTGRVTDTEWMADNAQYAAEIVRFARAKAREDGHADLRVWADKLAQAMQTDALFGRENRMLGLASVPAPQRLLTPGAVASRDTGVAPTDSVRYVRGLR
jgi:hypothetical protein